MVTPPHSSPPSSGFTSDARASVQRLRSSLAAAFSALDADPSRPQSLARQFNLDKSLAWRISKVLTAADPLRAVLHVPGRSGLRIVLRTLENAGCAAPMLAEIRLAIRDFESLIERHAGDRETLAMMVENLDPDSGRRRAESHRKMSFVGNSATWGVRAHTHLSSHILAPSAASNDTLDVATACGLLGFRRLRPEAPWAVATIRGYQNDDGTSLPSANVTPIDESAAALHGAPILAEFSSSPLPALRVMRDAHGSTRLEIVEGPIGKTAAATCLAAWIRRNSVPIFREESNKYGELFVMLNTPAEVLYHDVFIHRALPFQSNPAVFVYSQLPGGPVYPSGGREKGLLPIAENLVDLGMPPFVTTRDVPRYRELFETVCRRAGWDPADIHGYRFRLKYPPIPAIAVFRFELPQRPA